MKNLKVLGIIVLVVVLGAGGWFLVTKQSQKNMEVKNESQQEEKQVVKEDNQKQSAEKVEDIDTSNWKTYRNEELGFEVRYPRDWKVKQMKFATVWPAPTPINCDKTPEKCEYVGVGIVRSNDIIKDHDDTINYVNIKMVADNRLQKRDGFYVDMVKGSEFAPGDMCLLAYVKTMSGKKRILMTTLQNKVACGKNKHNKLFDLIANSLKSF